MDSNEETTVTSIDIFDIYDSLSP